MEKSMVLLKEGISSPTPSSFSSAGVYPLPSPKCFAGYASHEGFTCGKFS